MEKDQKKRFWEIVSSIFVIVFSLLLLIAIMQKDTLLINDFNKLISSNLSFIKIITLNFPDVTNSIGPFGVVFGYLFLSLFGKIVSLSILLSMIIVAFFKGIIKIKSSMFIQTLSFVLFSFFAQLISFSYAKGYPDYFAGIIPMYIHSFMIKVFGNTGCLLISIIIFAVAFISLINPSNLIGFFVWFYNILKNLFKKKETTKTKDKKKEKPKKEKKSKKKKELKITDHRLDNDEDNPIEIEYNPKIKPRQLSQNKKDMPEDEDKREYVLPSINEFLKSKPPSKKDREKIAEHIKKISGILESKLKEFGVEAEVINVNIGPVITQYEINPAPGVKVSKFHTLADDLALAIKATSIRVQAPIPGRGLVGIEIPNIAMDTIYLKDILLSEQMVKNPAKLAIGLGKDISGNSVIADLSKMPHLLIAGATGAGKSVCINTIISSILVRTTPDEVRFVLIDPKRIELAVYQGIPHLIQNVVTDNEDALTALNWAVSEMERRYELLTKYNVRNINSYNDKIRAMQKLFEQNPETAKQPEDIVLPYIVIIIDEFADLIMTIGREIELPITRLAQMARAIGIHLILATQRPSSKIITGVIKANFPSRIAFRVASKIDSRVILDVNGAEKLLGRGDSLFLPPGKSEPIRIHGAFISDEETLAIVEYLKTQPKPKHEIKIIPEEDKSEMSAFEYDDELFPEAAKAVVFAKTASVSMLQRHFKIGYARAGRLIDMLEQAGIIGPHVGSKSREVLATEEDLKIYGYIKEDI
jgi:S-DNA-T family DNA segregation ATPase FtsK/SpoIIIE